jgi:hypothetical protein
MILSDLASCIVQFAHQIAWALGSATMFTATVSRVRAENR